MKYRKKPIIIDAIQYHADVEALPFHPYAQYRHESSHLGPSLMLKTLEGWYVVTDKDFIIKGVAGEFYPCKPNVFHATYEPVAVDPPKLLGLDLF